LRGGAGDFSPIQAYARAGLGVFVVDRPEDMDLLQRVADDTEIERENWQGLKERRDIVAALNRGVDILVDRGDVDPHRIGISGLSDGAATTAYAIGHSHRFRAASMSGGSWEPILFYMSSPAARAELATYGMGAPGSADDRNWDGISLTRNAAAIDTPLLIQSADREIGMYLQPLATLQTLHKPVEAYIFSDEYHVMWQPQHRMAMYERNLDWFRFWLQNYEDPDPAKHDQYLRWRAMRESGQH
jgi:dipeptidyl aminopeptidase/acylaminoacyl peptidase